MLQALEICSSISLCILNPAKQDNINFGSGEGKQSRGGGAVTTVVSSAAKHQNRFICYAAPQLFGHGSRGCGGSSFHQSQRGDSAALDRHSINLTHLCRRDNWLHTLMIKRSLRVGQFRPLARLSRELGNWHRWA